MKLYVFLVALYTHSVKYKMSTVKRRKVGRKKKQLLLGVRKYWMCEDQLLPTYSHLVDNYSDNLREEWNNVQTTTKVKQEPEDVGVWEKESDTSLHVLNDEVCVCWLIFDYYLLLLLLYTLRINKINGFGNLTRRIKVLEIFTY